MLRAMKTVAYWSLEQVQYDLYATTRSPRTGKTWQRRCPSQRAQCSASTRSPRARRTPGAAAADYDGRRGCFCALYVPLCALRVTRKSSCLYKYISSVWASRAWEKRGERGMGADAKGRRRRMRERERRERDTHRGTRESDQRKQKGKGKKPRRGK